MLSAGSAPRIVPHRKQHASRLCLASFHSPVLEPSFPAELAESSGTVDEAKQTEFTQGEPTMQEKQVLERAFRDAADEPCLSARTVPVRQPRIPDHHLSHRSGEVASGGARAARIRRARSAW